ncbi:MAG: glucosylglycerol hydrolase [Azospirillaceae bacterium]
MTDTPETVSAPTPRPEMPPPVFDEHKAASLAHWCGEEIVAAGDPFAAAQRICRRLGTRVEDDRVLFGFWAPELLEEGVGADDAFLEIWRPVDALGLATREQTVRFRRFRLPLRRHEEFAFSAAANIVAGNRQTVGDLYWLRYRGRDGGWRTLPDYVAWSVPFGAFAPAEVYDIDRLQAERGDKAYWRALAATADADGLVRQGPAVNILQIHTRTGSAGGTLAGLTRIYSVIAAKLRNGQPLVTEEEPYADYDAVQLLPLEPIIEYEAGPRFWEVAEDADGAEQDDAVAVTLRRPDCTNWGYDIVISASSAINPAILDSGRPDELVDLAAVLHGFPGKPIRLILDVVFGHADNQAVPLISRHFFAGPNMYGQDLNYRHPVVRALLLEMQRRKVDFGADGVRVDGAQDFKWWDADAGIARHDDAFLREMTLVEQEVAGCRYRPWMIFEDGRPWPQVDWELASNYRAVIEDQKHISDDIFQWGPLTFAHNTPFLFTFWMNKQWRIEEMLSVGANWISGTANHDTLRRGYQVDPEKGINSRLGDTLLEILDTAYDNPTTSLFTHAFLPGVPMEFLNAAMRASWAFIRNTDDRYGVKVVAEESTFFTWQVDEEHYGLPMNFRRLKDLGFEDLDGMRRFLKVLVTAVEATDYDLDAMADVINAVTPALPATPVDVAALKRFARAWMDDVHDYCNVAYYRGYLSPALTGYNRALRRFRADRPWLRGNLGAGDAFRPITPVAGSVVFTGTRASPDGAERLFLAAHMEGAPKTFVPLELGLPGLDGAAADWRIALATPGLAEVALDRPVTLSDCRGFVALRRTV